MALLLSACGDDPSLRVIVEHDPDFVDLVDRTTIVVYEGDNITCTAIEFDDISGSQLDAFEVARVETDDLVDSGKFDDVFSRTGHKAIVARGFNNTTGNLVVAECADVDEVFEGDSITIVTDETATVSVAAAEDGLRGVLVLLTDPKSRPIEDRPVSWRLHGAAGTSADSTRFTNITDGIWEPKNPTCTNDGEATIHPAPPKLPGGFAVQARVSWASERPTLFTQFTELDLEESEVIDPTIMKPCAVRRNGTSRGVVCLETPTRAHEYTLTGKVMTRGPAQTVAAAVALVSVEQNGNLDVYAISDNGAWEAVSNAPAANGGQWCPACSTFDLHVLPACGSEPSVLMGKVGQTDVLSQMRTMPLKGGVGTVFRQNGSAIANAGCLTELQTDGSTITRQAVVLETAGAGVAPARVSFKCAADDAGCDIPLLNEGVGFIAGTESQMVVSSFDATGTVLSTVVARPNETPNPMGRREDRLIERSRQPAAAPPSQLVVGGYDADEASDLIWHFPTLGNRASNIQIAYAREVDGTPITAILPVGGVMVELLTGDLNNDLFDEAMLLIDRLEGAQNIRRLLVVPIGIAYTASSQVPDDPPCPPTADP